MRMSIRPITKMAAQIVMQASLIMPIVCSGQGLNAEIHVDDVRPLPYAIKALQKNLHIKVTFEEVKLEYEGDFKDYDGIKGAIGGPLNFSYRATDEPVDILQALLEEYESKYPGSYQLIEGDNYFHVVPKSSRNANGVFVARESILDTPLSINMKNVSSDDVLTEITTQLTEKIGFHIDAGTMIRNFRAHQYESYELIDKPARVHLEKVFNEVGGDFSWMLFRDARIEWSAINIYSL